MDDGIAIEFIHGGHDAVLKFLFGRDADVAKHGAGELGEEALDEIEPGAVFGRVDERRSVLRTAGRAKPCLLGYVGGMIVEDELDRGRGRMGGVEQLQEFDEFARAMSPRRWRGRRRSSDRCRPAG